MEGPELAKRHLVGRRDTGRHAREVNDRANHRTKYRSILSVVARPLMLSLDMLHQTVLLEGRTSSCCLPTTLVIQVEKSIGCARVCLSAPCASRLLN